MDDPAVADYLTWLTVERGRSPNTLRAYRRDLDRYLAFLAERGLSVERVSEADVVSYRAALRSAGLAPSTVARLLATVRGLHRFRAAEELDPLDPCSHVRPAPVPQGVPKALSEAQVLRLLESAAGATAVDRRDRAMLEVLYGTGIRVSELVGLRLDGVDLDGRLLRVLGKGRKERIVPLGRPAAGALEVYLDARPDLAPARWRSRDDAEALLLNLRGRRLTRQGAWTAIRGRARLAGLEELVSPHVLRHSCATHMLDHGADIRAVQELLGHASLSTTQVYTKVATSRLFEAYRASHPRARGARSG